MRGHHGGVQVGGDTARLFDPDELMRRPQDPAAMDALRFVETSLHAAMRAQQPGAAE
jgi:hypothetical protein